MLDYNSHKIIVELKDMLREQALGLVKKKIKNKNLVNHCLAVEAIMKNTAIYLNKNHGLAYDEEKWAMAGLVHDIDYETTKDKPESHSIKAADFLDSLDFDKDIVYAVKAHNQLHKLKLKSDMDISLYAADPLSGLIVASALIKPEKKLRYINTGFVMNRFKERSFARGADRQQIMEIERIGLKLVTFVKIGLTAMTSISSEIGL